MRTQKKHPSNVFYMPAPYRTIRIAVSYPYIMNKRQGGVSCISKTLSGCVGNHFRPHLFDDSMPCGDGNIHRHGQYGFLQWPVRTRCLTGAGPPPNAGDQRNSKNQQPADCRLLAVSVGSVTDRNRQRRGTPESGRPCRTEWCRRRAACGWPWVRREWLRQPSPRSVGRSSPSHGTCTAASRTAGRYWRAGFPV